MRAILGEAPIVVEMSRAEADALRRFLMGITPTEDNALFDDEVDACEGLYQALKRVLDL